MSDIVPIRSKSRDVRDLVSMLRDLADGLERGSVGHVIVVADRDIGPEVLMSVAEGSPLVTMIGAIEVAKQTLLQHVMNPATKVAAGEA